MTDPLNPSPQPDPHPVRSWLREAWSWVACVAVGIPLLLYVFARYRP
jgi:hypothetical protein